ncbi:hypothetical protein LZ32DRAFT_189311 [Colletotrichum eremochloae]|nr:hypothetical protein LZ32DRAFT_189311 [Colletotrichum eremochloae]
MAGFELDTGWASVWDARGGATRLEPGGVWTRQVPCVGGYVKRDKMRAMVVMYARARASQVGADVTRPASLARPGSLETQAWTLSVPIHDNVQPSLSHVSLRLSRCRILPLRPLGRYCIVLYCMYALRITVRRYLTYHSMHVSPLAQRPDSLMV